MSGVVGGAVDDFEIIQSVVRAVTVLVVNVFRAQKRSTERQLHHNAMNSDGAVNTGPTGIQISTIFVNAASPAIDRNPLGYFDLLIEGNGDCVYVKIVSRFKEFSKQP